MPVNYPIESVANALRLLSSFKDRSAVGVSEAGRELGVARSTAHRLLAMLQEHGYLARRRARIIRAPN
jgi:IclR family transcriptional regulator, acetate operon repressor